MPDYFDAFKLPPQHLDTLSFCNATPRALGEWLIQQPLGKPKQLSVLLYTLLPEINQLNCSSLERIELLDIMRPAVYQCVASSHEMHLRQPLQLDTQSTRVAMMSHALLRHLCDGYLIAIKTELGAGNSQSHLAKCFFFALHSLGQLHFHCAQLYAGTAPLFWLKAHQLYQVAAEHGIADLTIPAYYSPEENRTIAQAYKRLILLACSDTNQLPQVDIGYLYTAFEDWADMVSIVTNNEGNKEGREEDEEKSDYEYCRYWANPAEDTAPHNRDQHKSDADIGFDFTDIILLLQTHNHYAPGKSVREIPTFFRHSLAEHLLQCWQHIERRKQARQAIDERFEICVGLDNAYTLLNHQAENTSPALHVNAIDASPDGLCLRWQKRIPEQTAPGECILIRSPGKALWRIGIIRWVQRLNQFTYAGIQLLSNHVAPTAATICWDQQGNAQSHHTIAFENHKNKANCMDLLLPKDLAESTEGLEHATLETDHGEEALLELAKLAEFSGAQHYTCKIVSTPSRH